MKIAIFGDLHMGIRHNSPDWHQVAYDWADSMIAVLKERGVKDIVFLGDFFHNRNMISVNTLDAAGKFIRKFKEFNLHMILGNHDLFYDKEFTTSGVNLFDEADYIKVYREPEKVRMGMKDLVFCGWGYDPLQYEGDILFTHAEISMFMTRRGVPREEGYKISDLLSQYPLVYSGHYHMRQRKDYERGSVRYVGNPFQMDFSDEGMEKGFDIYDLETGELEFVENRISPVYLTSRLSSIMKTGNFKALAEEMKGNYFKLIIDKPIKLPDVDRLVDMLKSFAPRDVVIEWEDGSGLVKGPEGEPSFEVNGFDFRNLLEEYIDLYKVDDKEWIKRYILDLHAKVEN